MIVWRSLAELEGMQHLGHIYVHYSGVIVDRIKEKFIPQIKTNTGYNSVWLSGKFYLVHRLVAQLFVGIPDGDLVVDHIDRVRTNNHFQNLQWVTRSENSKRRIDYSKSEIKSILATNLKTGEKQIYKSAYQAEKALGGTRSEIYRVCKGERKSSNGYKFEYIEIR